MRLTKLPTLFFPLFVICIFSLVLGQFSVIYKFNEGSIYLFDILIALFDIMGLYYLFTSKKSPSIPLPIFFLLVFCLLGAVSLIFTPLNLEISEFAISASYLVRFFSYVLFSLVVLNLVKLDILKVDSIKLMIVYSGIFLFIAGLVQLAFLPDLETLDPSLGWDPHKNRMVSTFFDPNFLGSYFVVCLAVSFRMIENIRNKKLFDYLPAMVFLVGIFLTFSRSAWLATSVLLFFILLKKKFLLFISLSIVLLAIFAVPRIQTRISGITDPQDSAQFRLISWKNTWEIAKDNWVFGVGYNVFRYAQKEFGFIGEANLETRSGAGSDSSLLLVLATTGIIGLIFFTGFIIVVLLSSLKTHDLITIGLISALLTDSLFINSLFYPQIVVLFLILLIIPMYSKRACA